MIRHIRSLGRLYGDRHSSKTLCEAGVSARDISYLDARVILRELRGEDCYPLCEACLTVIRHPRHYPVLGPLVWVAVVGSSLSTSALSVVRALH